MTHRHLTFFEMLGNFSVGDYFKQGAVEFALDLSTNGFGLEFERIWITVFGGDEELGLGPDERGDRVLARGRRAGRAHRPAGPRRQLLAVRSHRSLRPLLGALHRPRAGLRRRQRPSRRRHRAPPRVLEPRLHAIRAPGRRLAARAAGAEHRHGDGPGAHVRGAPGGRVGLRHRPLPSAGRPRARRAAVGATARTSPPPERCGSWPTMAER